jgi:hypothetical protein
LSLRPEEDVHRLQEITFKTCQSPKSRKILFILSKDLLPLETGSEAACVRQHMVLAQNPPRKSGGAAEGWQ